MNSLIESAIRGFAGVLSSTRGETDHHADALRTARALAAGHGWIRTRAILTAIHHGDVPAALAAVDDSHAELARERTSVGTATQAFTRAATEPAPAVRPHARIGQVAAGIGVRTPVLRLWERRGLLRPHRDRATGYRIYDLAEQRTARLVAVLRAGRFSFPIIDAVIATMRSSGSVGRALAELSRRDEQVHRRSRERLRASAAVHAYLAAYYPDQAAYHPDEGESRGAQATEKPPSTKMV